MLVRIQPVKTVAQRQSTSILWVPVRTRSVEFIPHFKWLDAQQ